MILSGTQYLCAAGETFDGIALIVYGDERYAADLMNANPELVSVPMFTGGELLELPVIEIPNQTGEKYMQPTAPWKE